ANRVKRLDSKEIDGLVPNTELALAIKANLAMLQCADGQIDLLEKAVLDRVKLKPEFELLKTAPGIGLILALTIMLETGDITRFPTVGVMLRIVGVWEARRSATARKKAA